MNTSQTLQHYETHLADYYSWMFGGLEKKIAEHSELFRSLQLEPVNTAVAIDLGAGNGIQSIPLAEAGYNVTAIDFSNKLLTELETVKKDLPIQTIEADILAFDRYNHLQPELIVCMGDTLPHLPSLAHVQDLFQHIYQQLVSDGQFIVSFRDLSHELKSIERFIPVRSDNDTIFTCFLEYFEGHIMVHDIIQQRYEDIWRQKISSYKKLRLSADVVISLLKEIGFSIISHGTFSGMQLIVAKKGQDN